MCIRDRDKEEERLRMREAQLFRRLEALREQGFGAEAVRTQWTPPVAMDPTLVKDIHAAAEAEGLSYLHIDVYKRQGIVETERGGRDLKSSAPQNQKGLFVV